MPWARLGRLPRRRIGPYNKQLRYRPHKMPPKKRSRASRASKLVAELDLTPEEEEEVAEVWSMYVDEEASEDVGEEVIATRDVRRVLIGMGFESSKEELNEILEIVDPDDEGWVTYERFLPVASLKLKDRDVHEEAEKAFQIFTAGQPGPITMEHLKRVAERLKEDVTDDQLREMLAVACTKEISKGVDLNDFQAVMKRAGVL